MPPKEVWGQPIELNMRAQRFGAKCERGSQRRAKIGEKAEFTDK